MNIKDAPKLAKYNKHKLEDDAYHGCYHCMWIFAGRDIVKFVDNGETAICPHCGIDSVLPEVTNTHFLSNCSEAWFAGKDEEQPEPVNSDFYETHEWYENPDLTTDESTTPNDMIMTGNISMVAPVYEYMYIQQHSTTTLSHSVNVEVEGGWEVDGDVVMEGRQGEWAYLQRMRKQKPESLF